MIRDNTVMFLFCERFLRFFGPSYNHLLHLDFDDYIQKKGDIKLMEYQKFDVSDDPMDEICLNSKTQMTCMHRSGKIVFKDLNTTTLWTH